MSATARRVIDLFFNRELGFRVSESNKTSQNASSLNLWRGENVLLRWHTYDSDGAVVPIEAGTTFSYGIDQDFSDGDAGLAFSGGAEFVPADWTGAGAYDLAEGRVCGRIDLNTDELETAMLEKQFSVMYLVFWAFPPSLGGKAEQIGFLPIRMNNVPINPDASSPVSVKQVRVVVDWSTAGSVDIPLSDPFALSRVLMASDGDLTDLGFDLGTIADPDLIVSGGVAFTDLNEVSLLTKFTGGVLRLTINTPATAPSVAGWVMAEGVPWS